MSKDMFYDSVFYAIANYERSSKRDKDMAFLVSSVLTLGHSYWEKTKDPFIFLDICDVYLKRREDEEAAELLEEELDAEELQDV